MFGWFAFAFRDFYFRRFSQNSTDGNNFSFVSNQIAQIVWRNDCSVKNQICPACEREQQHKSNAGRNRGRTIASARTANENANKAGRAAAGKFPQAATRLRRTKRRRRAGASFLFLQFRFPAKVKNPEREQPDRAAGRVNENVRDERCARRHKTLVEFIARGVKKNDQQSSADFRPRPLRQVVF